MEKMLNSPFFNKSVEWKGTEVGETEYIDRGIYLEYVQTGTDEKGKAIGSVQPVVKETKTDIVALVNSEADSVGVKNLIRMFARTGDVGLFNQAQPLPAGDYTSIKSSTEIQAIYESLPDELKKGRTYEEFMKNFTEKEFEAFVTQVASSQVDNKEGDNNE